MSGDVPICKECGNKTEQLYDGICVDCVARHLGEAEIELGVEANKAFVTDVKFLRINSRPYITGNTLLVCKRTYSDGSIENVLIGSPSIFIKEQAKRDGLDWSSLLK